MRSDPCLSLLRDLVAIDSVNPSLVPGGRGEGAIAGAIAQRLRELGVDVEIQEVAPGRPNVVGVLEGRQRGPALMLCGHVDTVGVDGMDAPFDPIEREGRLYGRGSQDMKGGIAAMVDAARIVADRGLAKGRLIVAAVVDEEYASLGAEALVTRWGADLAVVTEPTDLRIGVAHKGFVLAEIETLGRAAHGSRPQEGRDAILRMGRVLTWLETLDGELQSRVPHALLGTGSLHASIVSGGREMSTYPDRCVLQLERRTIPGETDDQVREELSGILESLGQYDPEFQAHARLIFSRSPYELPPPGHALPRLLSDVLGSIGRRAELVGMSFWTDAAILGGAGIPAALFGPGGAGLHGREEYVNVADVLACRDALAILALTLPERGV